MSHEADSCGAHNLIIVESLSGHNNTCITWNFGEDVGRERGEKRGRG